MIFFLFTIYSIAPNDAVKQLSILFIIFLVTLMVATLSAPEKNLDDIYKKLDEINKSIKANKKEGQKSGKAIARKRIKKRKKG